MKLRIWLTSILCAFAANAQAQVVVPNTFTPNTIISSSQINANFATLLSALNRTGGTITGNITVSAGVTIDGIDISGTLNQAVLTTSSPTFAALTITNGATVGTSLTVGTTLGVTGATTLTGALNANGAVDIAAGLTIGSGNVSLVTAAGKITAISSTYFDSLDGTNLTGLAKLASNNTFTARQDFTNYTEKGPAAAIAAGTLTLNLSTGTHFEVPLNANINTLTISNVPNPADGVVAFTIAFTADGTPRTITWPASVKWPSGTAPTMTSTNTKIDIITFVSYDAGTSWLGFVGGQSF